MRVEKYSHACNYLKSIVEKTRDVRNALVKCLIAERACNTVLYLKTVKGNIVTTTLQGYCNRNFFRFFAMIARELLF